jgi:lysophospholipase L1-like esterase
MRKSIWVHLLSLVICLSLSVEAGAQKHEFANYKRYAKANSELPKVTKKDKRVVFMGNSITEGWPMHRPEFFKENPNYVGRGIGGQTSYQFLLRFREDVVKLNPKVVIINAGTNDVAENTGPYNEEFTFNNIVSMVDIAKANKIKVILTSVLPAARFGWHPHVTDAPDKIISLNKRIEAYAKANKIPYVDYYKALVDEDGRTLPKKYSNDGVHPLPDGYKVMEALIQPVIKKLL